MACMNIIIMYAIKQTLLSEWTYALIIFFMWWRESNSLPTDLEDHTMQRVYYPGLQSYCTVTFTVQSKNQPSQISQLSLSQPEANTRGQVKQGGLTKTLLNIFESFRGKRPSSKHRARARRYTVFHSIPVLMLGWVWVNAKYRI